MWWGVISSYHCCCSCCCCWRSTRPTALAYSSILPCLLLATPMHCYCSSCRSTVPRCRLVLHIGRSSNRRRSALHANQLCSADSPSSPVSVARRCGSSSGRWGHEGEFLGVVLVQRLTFHKHVSMIARSCDYHALDIRHTRHLLSTELASSEQRSSNCAPGVEAIPRQTATAPATLVVSPAADQVQVGGSDVHSSEHRLRIRDLRV